MLHLPHAQARPRAGLAAAARPPSAISSPSSQPLVHRSSLRRSCSFAAAPSAARTTTVAAAKTIGAASSIRHHHRRCSSSARVSAASAAAASAATTTADASSPATFQFACPICHTTPFALPLRDPYAADCPCPRCGRTFLVDRGGGGNGGGNNGSGNGNASGSASANSANRNKSAFVDLTLESGARPRVFEQKSWVGTELFRAPAISSIYEKGWRQGFARAGFPGPQREFDLAMRYFGPVLGAKAAGGGGQEGEEEKDEEGWRGSGSGGANADANGGGGEKANADARPVLVDASCGTGLFTRLFARSGQFSGIVALDYSETMLRETRRLLAAASSSSPAPPTPVVAVRADIARLPFATGSVRAIHAGAALHCWPNPSAAMAEISRVLAPGGVFVASTFLNGLAPLGAVVGDERLRPLTRLSNPFGFSSSFRSWEEAELVDLCREVGLVGYERTRDASFILLTARKPGF